jgi:signal transduction histidine kinase
MKTNFEFLKRIKTRIALAFSILFLIVAIPAIIYIFGQVTFFVEWMYLQQMRVAALTARTILNENSNISYDSLTTKISSITSTTVFLISPNGGILSRYYEEPASDSAMLLSFPILNSGTTADKGEIRHKYIQVGFRKYLQVQIELAGGLKLLQVKSFANASKLMARMREVIFWSSFLGLMALIAVAFWVSAKITKPIEELTIFAKRIRLGDLPEKTSVQSPDELGDLADALNNIVDDLNRSQDRLDRLENMRREFFANVREKMELPVISIQNNLHRLLDISDGQDKSARESLERALGQSKNLQQMIRSLIEISQLEYGEISLELKTFHLRQLLDEFEREFKPKVAAKGLCFEFDFAPGLELVLVIGDKAFLNVVLRNLVSNALDFTDKGFIKISCVDEDEKVRINIEDSGRGIPQNQLDRIFERFYRVIEPEFEDYERTGLGLAIAKHIIDAHEQRIEVESTLGVGSCFSFWLKKAKTPG